MLVLPKLAVGTHRKDTRIVHSTFIGSTRQAYKENVFATVGSCNKTVSPARSKIFPQEPLATSHRSIFFALFPICIMRRHCGCE
jgi:hypothetical protein